MSIRLSSWAAQDVAEVRKWRDEAENHARCQHCGQTGRWRASRRSSSRTTLHHTPAGAPRRFLKEREIHLLTWPPCSPDLSPLDFHFWQEWETALGERQFTSQLDLRAMIARVVSALDPEAAEKACTTGFIHRCLACVCALGGHFEHSL